jgi:hypothetical protein
MYTTFTCSLIIFPLNRVRGGVGCRCLTHTHTHIYSLILCVEIVSTRLSQQPRLAFLFTRKTQLGRKRVYARINIATIAGRERKYLGSKEAVFSKQPPTISTASSDNPPARNRYRPLITRTVTRAHRLRSGFMRICHSTMQCAYAGSWKGAGQGVHTIRRNRSSGVQTRRYTFADFGPLINSQL